MENKDGSMVLPGDELAYAEEYAPGDYTYEEDGKVRSAALGTARFDLEDRVVHVVPKNPIIELAEEDVVIGSIKDIRKSLAFVEIAKVAGKDRRFFQFPDGILHISRVKEGFVSDISTELQLGDIIRARVVQARPNIQLSTEGPDMGILKSVCSNCREALVVKDHKLHCERCNRYYHWKKADDYGSGLELPEAGTGAGTGTL